MSYRTWFFELFTAKPQSLLAALALAIGCAEPPNDRVDAQNYSAAKEELSLSSPDRDDLTVRQERIRRHFADRLARYQIVATTVTERGTIVDWVPKPSNSELPPTPAERPELEFGEAWAESPLKTQPQARGPEGTVPIVRFDVERYLETFGENIPDDPMEVGPPPPAPVNSRYHAVWAIDKTTTSFFMGKAIINLWDAPDLVTGDTNIAQIAAFRSGQSVEAGKIQWSGWNGGDPTLFVFYTTNNWGAYGDWVSGYNQDWDGWCQTGSTWTPQLELQASAYNGTQVVMDVRIELWNNKWFVWVIDEWMGYYPKYQQTDATCSSSTSTYLFSNAGMRNEADSLHFYGEVFDGASPNPTVTDMGSGYAAQSGQGWAAYFRTVRVAPTSGISYVNMHSATGNRWHGETDSGCYTIQEPQNLGGSTVNRFYYGGDGDDAPYCY